MPDNLATKQPISSNGTIKTCLEMLGGSGAGDHSYYFTAPPNSFVSAWWQDYVSGKPEIQDGVAVYTKSLQVKDD